MRKLYETMMSDMLGKKELVGVNYECVIRNAIEAKNAGVDLVTKLCDDLMLERKHQERHFYDYIRGQLLSRIQELKHYSNVNVLDTRRWVAVTSDCISVTQIMIRDRIHVCAYFRSSAIDTVLPMDLEFLSSLPQVIIDHLSEFQDSQKYSEVTPELISILSKKEIQFNLSFGSLHKAKE